MWSGLWFWTYAQHETCRRKTFLCLCFRFSAFSSCLLDRQEGSCKQSAVQVLQAGSGRHATAVVWCYAQWNTSLTHCHPAYTPHQPAGTSVVLVQLLQQKTHLTKIGIPVVILKICICIWRALYCLQAFFFKLGSVFLENKYNKFSHSDHFPRLVDLGLV